MEDHQHKPILMISIFLPFLLILFMANAQLLPINNASNSTKTQIYIVHVLKPEGAEFLGADDLQEWHKSILPNTTLDSGEPRLVFSYRRAISGFAARLTHDEVQAMERNVDGFLGAELDSSLELQTTYTPKFLNLSTLFGVWDTSNSFFGQDIVIGVMDSGIHPIHPSFSDDQMSAVPPGWSANCSFSRYSCNNKIIGAQAFHPNSSTNSSAGITPEDTIGHGTHVAGIAAGNFVENAEVLGQAMGKASGMAPLAYISVYKVCWPAPDGCLRSAVTAGIDQAMQDGVDILQMSFGTSDPSSLFLLVQDTVAVATFSAMAEGIFPCTTAGNDGPDPETLSHAAPWDMVVGASTTDRRIRATVTLGGDDKELIGETAYQPSSSSANTDFLPLIYPGANGGKNQTRCYPNSLDNFDVKGKIVVCKFGGRIEEVEKGKVVLAAGGAAMIIVNRQYDGFTTSSDPHHLPAVNVNYLDGMKILDYVMINSTATAKINFMNTIFDVRPSPALASFSSRGPSMYNGRIVKPDVLAPGVNILSAWPNDVGPFPNGLRTNTFNFQSGTSMASPHVSGIVALIMSKQIHENKRDWSPAEIQSALITTANTFDLEGKPIFDEASVNNSADIHQRGAGQVNATNAMDPGLVYDITLDDYIAYLCGRFRNRSRDVSIFTKNNTVCSRSISSEQLNYPSIGVSLGSSTSMVNIKRTVKNVGADGSEEVYWAKVEEPEHVRIDLSHMKLSFSRVEEEITYEINFSIKAGHHPLQGMSQGSLSWISDKHVVTSPIYVSF
ncbi:hypothetical protein J5N97_023426 [Dioscorea zingiberensis]|uniref:Uncharacterized protein n=1 Tax=Dioscorea zingiberensis TaxID=325984 RepID=A0A9D5C5Q6_9LILI|nr:hypothetical protein J5N97_023426 [Dioscorea zingiberensis]